MTDPSRRGHQAAATSPGRRPPRIPNRRRMKIVTPVTTPMKSRTGSHTIPNQMPAVVSPWRMSTRLAVDDGAGDLDRVRILGHDLATVAGEATQQVERILPAVDGDAVRDAGDRAVAHRLRLRRSDVAAHRADTVPCCSQRRGHVLDLQVDRPGPDDLRVIDELADLVGVAPFAVRHLVRLAGRGTRRRARR